MTDPTDDTQAHPNAGPDGDPGPAPITPPAAGPATDEAPSPAADPPRAADPPPAADPQPPLRADPDRPADSGWREPPWFPPGDGRRRERDRRPGPVAMVVGLVLIAVGAYYFLDRTLNIDMPRIQWAGLWPIVLIVLGILVLVRSFQRKA